MKIPHSVRTLSTRAGKLLLQKRGWKYTSVSGKEPGDDNLEGGVAWHKRARRSYYKRCLVLCGLGTVLIGLTGVLVITGVQYAQRPSREAQSDVHLDGNPFQPTKLCQYPSVRQEWRSLSSGEQQEYIRAVKCLMDRPSKLRTNGTLYDDFPWIHTTSGSFSHHAAAFLSWHRYFIHVFEQTLKQVCDYEGALAYWDWSLDWKDLANSSIWDAQTGFGGDGDVTGPTTVGEGRCVIDGPFAGQVNMFYGPKDRPHCLSRGFTDGQGHYGHIPGDAVHPDRIEEILDQDDYTSFFFALEKGPHDTIPNGIRGDFFSFTAPYDPVFYLHHTQLDRLWWLWQERNPRQRHFEYTGPAAMGSEQSASVYDQLPMSGFAEPLRVTDIMNTEGDFLCYRY